MNSHRKALDQMTPEQRAAIEAIRARRHAPEADADRDRFREEIRMEVPPASPDTSLLEIVAALRAERESQGLSLADVAERTRMDKATLSKLETGKVANPTYLTIRTYARALGKRVALRIEDEVPVGNSTNRDNIGNRWVHENEVSQYGLTMEETEWLANGRAAQTAPGTYPAARIIGLTVSEEEALIARRQGDEAGASARRTGKTG